MRTHIGQTLPGAELHPVVASDAGDRTRMLFNLPVRLDPGPVPPAFGSALWTPVGLSLIGAWTCLIVASLAVAALLRGAIVLSERRGTFVSSDTHELRTPLTTFRMYTDMLASGMVRDEAQRQSYVTTLRTESDRLAHLVENVLAYSRLERGRANQRIEHLTIGELVERLSGRLRQRAEQAGFTLVTDLAPGVAETPVRTDLNAVDQILFNLVDNACKYAAMAEDRRIHLSATRRDGHVDLRISDHGPGIVAKAQQAGPSRQRHHQHVIGLCHAGICGPGLDGGAQPQLDGSELEQR